MQSVTISNNSYHNESFNVNGEDKRLKIVNPTIPIFIVATSLIASPINTTFETKSPYISYVNSKSNANYTFSSKNDIINISIEDKEEKNMTDKFYDQLKDSERYLLDEIKSANKQTKDDLSDQISSLSGKVEKLSEDVNSIKVSMTELNENIKNLPNQLKASKLDFWTKSILLPAIMSIIVAVITGFVMLKLGLKKL